MVNEKKGNSKSINLNKNKSENFDESWLKPMMYDDDGKEIQKHVLGDIDYVRKSNFLILNIDEGDRPCGTFVEAFLAFERRIPIYMIQNMALYKYNKSLLGWVIGSGGKIFDNQKQLLEFLDKEYKLRIKKQG